MHSLIEQNHALGLIQIPSNAKTDLEILLHNIGVGILQDSPNSNKAATELEDVETILLHNLSCGLLHGTNGVKSDLEYLHDANTEVDFILRSTGEPNAA